MDYFLFEHGGNAHESYESEHTVDHTDGLPLNCIYKIKKNS